jgi:ribonuclease BN (tRNA processing enzyme)
MLLHTVAVEAPREVVAVSATTPPSKCEAMLLSSATALIHESILSFAAAQHLGKDQSICHCLPFLISEVCLRQ